VTTVTVPLRERVWNSPVYQGVSFASRNEDSVITSQGSLPTSEVCARIRQFGYAASQHIRIYGEDFDVLSDPFPIDGGIAIQVCSQRTKQARVLQLPATVIHRVKETILRAS
jgi:hypothetical protein